jgi:hypothetical protein
MPTIKSERTSKKSPKRQYSDDDEEEITTRVVKRPKPLRFRTPKRLINKYNEEQEFNQMLKNDLLSSTLIEPLEPEPMQVDESSQQNLEQTFEHMPSPRQSYFYDEDFRFANNSMLNQNIPEESFVEYLDQFHEMPREYISGYIRDTNNKYDTTYLKHDQLTDRMYFGDSEINFNGPDLTIKGKTFKGTPGLFELIFKTAPLKNKFNENDENVYAEIINLTNATRRNFDPKQQVIGNRGIKYTHTIKPILQRIKEDMEREELKRQTERDKELRIVAAETHVGEGVNTRYLKVNNKDKEYLYWNDPNELVARLRLLIASTEVGNNSHNNEIINIEKELIEAGIIEPEPLPRLFQDDM